MIIFNTIKTTKNIATEICSNGLPMLMQRLIALLALLMLAPVLLISMLAIKFESKGPIVFRQVRVGEQGRRFTMYKFRSMYTPEDPHYQLPTKSDRSGICTKYFNDPRITPVGRIIRKLSIDELPQIFNVFFGDMALIGPRPALPREVDAYQDYMLHRLDVKPGLTGLWQISGRADIDFSQQILLDFKYVEERTFWLDLKILFATIPAVVSGRGAY